MYGINESIDKYSYMDIYHFNALEKFDNYIERVYAEYHEDYEGGKHLIVMPSKYVRKGAKYSLVINVGHKEYRRAFEVTDFTPSVVDASTNDYISLKGIVTELDTDKYLIPSIKFNYSESNILFDLENNRMVVERHVMKHANYTKVNEDIIIPLSDRQIEKLPEKIDTVITFADYRFITIFDEELRFYDRHLM